MRETELLLGAVQNIARILRVHSPQTLRALAVIEFVAVQCGETALRLHSGRVLICRAVAGTAVIVAVAIAAVRTLLGSVTDQQTLLLRCIVGILSSFDDGRHPVIAHVNRDAVPNGGEAEAESTRTQ